MVALSASRKKRGECDAIARHYLNGTLRRAFTTRMQSTKLQYRSDVDGLRGIAVILVVGFHAFPTLIRSGFIGVDVFFVISGYLISRIIVIGSRQGSFSFLDFYRGRRRRIFPAFANAIWQIPHG